MKKRVTMRGAWLLLLLAAQPAWGDRTIPQNDVPRDPGTLAAAAMGAKVVDSIMGDLTGEGRDDALLVIDPAPAAHAGTRHPLEVVLMRRDAARRLHKVASNARLLACGPRAVSPGGYLSAERGAFTIVDPDRKADYRFVYDRDRREWLLATVSHLVVEARTGQERRQDLKAREFGRITFARFDPARLPSQEEFH